MANWTYTPGGTRFGDRIMAMKPIMFEKGLQKYWNELFTFVNRLIAGVATNIVAGNQFGLIDFGNVLDVTTAIPKNWADPMVGRQMPGYTFPTTQIFIFQGFNG